MYMKTTQMFLNWFNKNYNLGETDLVVDGILGKKSRALINLVLKNLQNEFKLLNYQWIINKPHSVYIRTNNVFTNQYTDWHIVININTKTKTEELYAYPCTTKSGNFYVYNPLTVGGITGTAVLKPGQYIDTWKFVTNKNWKTLWLGHPYFMQIKPVNIWRDGNKNNTIDKIISTSGLFGINAHTGGLGSLIDRWSAACLVDPRQSWLEMLKLNLFENGKLYTKTLLEYKLI